MPHSAGREVSYSAPCVVGKGLMTVNPGLSQSCDCADLGSVRNRWHILRSCTVCGDPVSLEPRWLTGRTLSVHACVTRAVHCWPCHPPPHVVYLLDGLCRPSPKRKPASNSALPPHVLQLVGKCMGAYRPLRTVCTNLGRCRCRRLSAR